jgi:hypothetical protein
MWAWKTVDVIRLKATEMRFVRNVKAKTRRENKWGIYQEEFIDIMKRSY